MKRDHKVLDKDLEWKLILFYIKERNRINKESLIRIRIRTKDRVKEVNNSKEK